MYKPSDRHGWESMYALDLDTIKRRYVAKIERLKEENKILRQENEKLKKYNDFLLQGVVRQYDEGRGKNGK